MATAANRPLPLLFIDLLIALAIPIYRTDDATTLDVFPAPANDKGTSLTRQIRSFGEEMAERNDGAPQDRRILCRIGINPGGILIEGQDILDPYGGHNALATPTMGVFGAIAGTAMC
jgi:hypothetical protein